MKHQPSRSSCPIARTNELVGDRWTILLLRELFFGNTRFSEMRRELGIAPDVLSNRLQTLVEQGAVRRQSYKEAGSRPRDEYVLTPSGRGLLPMLAAMADWSLQHRPPHEPTSTAYRLRGSNEPVQVAFITASGRAVDASEIELQRQ